MQLAAMLLAHGADIEATDHVGRTPLCEAAESDQTEMVQLLRSHGAKVTLPIAVRIGDLDAARELLQQGADPNEEGPFSKTALQIAIERRAPEFSDLLLAHGADLTLHEAAWMGDHERVRAILAAGVAVDAWDRFGKTALHWAAEHGHAEACRALLEAGADARAPRSSWEARMARVREQGAEAVKFLKKHGPGIGLRDQDRSTPVDLAKANHHTDVVHLLRAHLRATRPWWAFWRT
jgi:ankyrin repeat protein